MNDSVEIRGGTTIAVTQTTSNQQTLDVRGPALRLTVSEEPEVVEVHTHSAKVVELDSPGPAITAGGGGVFVLDAVGIGGIVGLKTYEADSTSLLAATSDVDTVRIHVGADGGAKTYKPAVTVNGVVATMTESSTKRWFTGFADITLTTGANTIDVRSSEGDTATAVLTRSGAGPAVVGVVFGSYPGTQTELKAGDQIAVTISTAPAAVSVTVQAAGASANEVTLPVSGGTAVGVVTVSAASGQQVLYVSAKNELGTEGAGFTSGYLSLNQAYPTLGPISVSYPVGQAALRAGDVGSLSMSASDFTTIAYSSSVVDIADVTTHEPTKSITQTASGYQGTGTNITVTATRSANAAVTTRTGLVKYATVAPTAVISIAGNPARLTSSPAGLDYEVRITPSQELSAAPSLSASAGVWQGAWTAGAGYWRRNLRIDDTITKGAAIFSSLSVTGLSGLTGSAITAGGIYTVGGISSRTLTVPAFSRAVAIGTQVTDQTKTTCSIAGGATLTRYADSTPRAGGYYISDASGNYSATGTHVALSDVSFAGSNTTGSLQLNFAEAA